MLRVKCLRQVLAKEPVQVVNDVTTVIIEDEYENPIGVVVELHPGVYQLVPVTEEELFHRILRGLGIDKVVITESLPDDVVRKLRSGSLRGLPV